MAYTLKKKQVVYGTTLQAPYCKCCACVLLFSSTLCDPHQVTFKSTRPQGLVGRLTRSTFLEPLQLLPLRFSTGFQHESIRILFWRFYTIASKVGRVGFEPTTRGFSVHCSTRLSYRPKTYQGFSPCWYEFGIFTDSTQPLIPAQLRDEE